MKARTQDARFFATARISENIVETPEGYLLAIGVPIARTGELLYREGELLDAEGNEVIEALDGVISVERDEDALFNPASMASFEGKPVTIGHPSDFAGPKNILQVMVGHMQNIRRGEGDDADKLIADLLIMEASAIAMVKAGLREISLGYDAKYDQIEPGRGRQTNLVGNHAALVRQGRNGSEVAVRDSAPDNINPRREAMKPSDKGFKEKFLGLFGRAFDEAMAEPTKETPQTPATDADAPIVERLGRLEEMLAKLCDITGANGGETTENVTGADDEGGDANAALTARLDTLEAALTKLLEQKSEKAAVDDEGAEVDENGQPIVKAKDENGVVCMDQETISRAEILVPGIKNSATLVKDTLEAFGKTNDGASVLKTLDSIKDEEALFVAAAELVKIKGGKIDVPTIDRFPSLTGTVDGAGKQVSPADLNAANAKRWGLQQ